MCRLISISAGIEASPGKLVLWPDVIAAALGGLEGEDLEKAIGHLVGELVRAIGKVQEVNVQLRTFHSAPAKGRKKKG